MNNSTNEDDILLVPEDVTSNDFFMSLTVVTPEVLANNSSCTIDTMEELQKYMYTSNTCFYLISKIIKCCGLST